ncbi:hypothetical protein AGMMS50293_30940 [Spirochaetia bacterium]|nr:hypothetical protein AGMMS50293_30940 [Spirochaetia bacterium]
MRPDYAGVHVVVNDDETDFSLWFGEAKFYNSIDNTRFSKIVASVKESLSAGKIKKENRIITSTQDLDLYIRNTDLLETIKTVLSDDTSLDIIRPKLHIPILLLYECEITSKYDEKSQEYLDELTVYHKERAVAYYTNQIKAMSDVPKYSDIHFHLIIFPVPKKEIIVSEFISTAKSLRGE